MNRRQPTPLSQTASALFATLVLCWLSVSLPFVCAVQHTPEITNTESNEPACADTSEEKGKYGKGSVEGYLHSLPHASLLSKEVVKFYKCRPGNVYLSFNPEFVPPPPKA